MDLMTGLPSSAIVTDDVVVARMTIEVFVDVVAIDDGWNHNLVVHIPSSNVEGCLLVWS